MAFDPLSWAIGFSLSTGANWLKNKALAKDLAAGLLSEVKDWAGGLPEEAAVVPEALFPGIQLEAGAEDRPALSELRRTLEENKIPTEAQWLDALLEQWRRIRDKDQESQPLFTRPEPEARTHLAELARKLVARCTQADELFKGTVVDELSNLRGLLEQFVGQHKEAKKKSWRPLDQFNLLLLADYPTLNKNYPQLFCQHLYRVFADSGYREFSSLLALGEIDSAVGRVQAVQLVTHEVTYTAELRATFKALLGAGVTPEQRQVVTEEINRQAKMLQAEWTVVMKLQLGPRVRAHKFLCDPDAKRLEISPVTLAGLPSKEPTTSQVLVFLSIVLSVDVLQLDDIGQINRSPALYKLVQDILEKKLDLNRLRTEVADSESWDYINPAVERELDGIEVA